VRGKDAGRVQLPSVPPLAPAKEPKELRPVIVAGKRDARSNPTAVDVEEAVGKR
jgi:hypothetical protein